MTDKDKIRLLMGMFITNQIAWGLTYYLMYDDNRFMVKKVDGMYDLILKLLDTAPPGDPEIEKMVIDLEFNDMSVTTMKRKSHWWRR